ncbi:S-methyl-5'-thioadenosine phosphorylase [Nocardia sp. 348MFTsu5.1]|uniref:S-methyl-5'-thioadenosine phosphorylase n=1 Tax=Nocardia sp. 348MFTsu5.1 TaxID=1172185 RepID=UPI000363A315|nr:S-methyl-5'-thioadenosine phosphorylase [Nocardia sp. 348MFTsu5.1]
MSADTQPRIGIIGGSGFYSFFDSGSRQVKVRTPYGDPSAAITIGDVDGVTVAFLPRHGTSHEYAPHTVPYRANAWALRSLGVRQVFAPCAVGGLTTDLEPGTMVIPDQLVDRTAGRAQTYFDGPAVHVAFSDPYCPTLRRAAAIAAPDAVVDGTMVVVEGPRFSTRAESQMYASQGFTLINMTGQPEAVLARELQMCYAAVALVTDTDAGLVAGEGVTASEVFAVFEQGLSRMREVLTTAIGEAARQPQCLCAQGEHDITDLMSPVS